MTEIPPEFNTDAVHRSELSGARAAGFCTLMVIALFSLAPFANVTKGPSLSSRLAGSFEFSREAIGPWMGLCLHACVFLPVGAAAMAWFYTGGRRAAWVSSLILAALIALLIEAYQVVVPSLHKPHVLDLAANLGGAVLGLAAAWRLKGVCRHWGVMYVRNERVIHGVSLARC